MTPAAGRGLVRHLTDGADRFGQGALALFILLGLATKLPADPGAALTATAVSLLAVVLIGRVQASFVLPCALLGSAGVAVLGGGRASNVGWFALCVFGAWCVLAGSRRQGLVYWLGSLALLAVQWLVASDPGWGAWMVGSTVSVCATTLLRHEIGLVAQLREAQAGLAERSRAHERSRIARDLHDVIAHSLTVSLLHVTSARLAVEHEPERAADSLAEAERLGRQSLTEVRSIVGLLGATEPGAGPAKMPVPGIGELAELADGFRRAGADVTLAVDGDLTGLPATTGSVLYRIVQEALTNAAKHAAGTPVVVRLASARDDVHLTVDSGGAAGTGTGQGAAACATVRRPWAVSAPWDRTAADGGSTPGCRGPAAAGTDQA